MPATPYEADLAARVNARAPGATEELFSRYGSLIRWSVNRWTGRRLSRVEVESETWVRILRTIGDYDPRGVALSQWLVWTSTKVIDWLARPRRKHLMVEKAQRLEWRSRMDPDETLADELMCGGLLLSKYPDPEANALRRERERRFGAAMRGLTRQRRAVLARYLAGKDHSEIAAELGVSRSAVGQFCRAAVEQVTRRMAA